MGERAGSAMFQSELIEPFVEQHVYKILRRREKAAELVAEYEREHGVITDEELAALDREWLT